MYSAVVYLQTSVRQNDRMLDLFGLDTSQVFPRYGRRLDEILELPPELNVWKPRFDLLGPSLISGVVLVPKDDHRRPLDGCRRENLSKFSLQKAIVSHAISISQVYEIHRRKLVNNHFGVVISRSKTTEKSG